MVFIWINMIKTVYSAQGFNLDLVVYPCKITNFFFRLVYKGSLFIRPKTKHFGTPLTK